MYDALTTFGGDHLTSDPSQMEQVNQIGARFDAHYNKLEELTRDMPEIKTVISRSRRAALDSMANMREIKESFDRAGNAESLYRKPMWKKLHKQLSEAINHDLLSVGSDQKRFADASPETQFKLRRQMQNTMVLVGTVNLFLTLIAAIYLTHGIASKVKRLSENTFRLASDLPLHPVMAGSDELSTLDMVFHRMAGELKEAARKEGALIQNARDLICSIDETGRFVAVNPASRALLGYDPDELLGKHLVDIVVPADAGRTLNYLEHTKESDTEAALETQLRRKDGTPQDMLCSAHFSKEEGYFFCVIHDITERKQAERLRQEVVAMVTHDLRTPLGTVSNILDFMQRGTFGHLDEKGEKYIISGQRNVERMMTLINDLLDIEKIQSGRMELSLNDLPLQDCFNSCRELHAGLAEDAGVMIEVVPTDITVRVDDEKILRLLSNLVANAIKFSPEGTTIKISAEDLEHEVQVHVQDQGPGIPEDQLDSVFERFQQVHGAQKKKGGSGLGLAICKAIAELHGGRIWAESKNGNGTRFTFSLPLIV